MDTLLKTSVIRILLKHGLKKHFVKHVFSVHRLSLCIQKQVTTLPYQGQPIYANISRNASSFSTPELICMWWTDAHHKIVFCCDKSTFQMTIFLLILCLLYYYTICQQHNSCKELGCTEYYFVQIKNKQQKNVRGNIIQVQFWGAYLLFNVTLLRPGTRSKVCK